MLCVGKSGFDISCFFSANHGVAALRPLKLFRFAEIEVILFRSSTEHFAVFCYFHFFGDGLSRFLFHRLFRDNDTVESAGETLHVFFDGERSFDARKEGADRVSCFIGERLFATTEHELHLHLLSARKEFFRLFSFEIEVMCIGEKPEADAFRFDFFLFALRLLFFLAFRVEVLAVVEYFADGRDGFGRHLDEVELLFARSRDRLFRRHIFVSGSVRIDEKNKRHADLFIHARFRSLDNFGTRSSISSSAHRKSFLVELMGIAPMSSDEP